jgi:hypothetical protein
MYWKYRNNKVKGKYIKMRDKLMTEFGAEYTSENRVIIQYEVLYLIAFIYMYLFIYDIFSSALISLWNEGIIWEQRIKKNVKRNCPSLMSGYVPIFLKSVEGKHV